jgi:sugar/nucleoside kinase (ribokinase family)
MTSFDVLILGDCNPDIVLSDPDAQVRFGQQESLFRHGGLTVGGSGSITACACARLGLKTMFVGAVGRDALGRYMLHELNERGIDTTGCPELDDAPTGFSVILSRGEDRAILTHTGAIERLARHHLPIDVVQAARHVHISSYFLLTELRPGLRALLETLKAADVSVSLDTNWDPTERWDTELISLLGLVDLFLPNAAEARAIARCDDVTEAARILARETSMVVVKLGAEGALLARAGSDQVEVDPGFALRPVDTTGAGDAFNAGFLRGWLNQTSAPACLRLANAVAALTTQALGAVPAQPDFERTTEFMNNWS